MPTRVRPTPSGRRWSLRHQLLVVLTGLTVPLLVVGLLSGLLMRSSATDHARSTQRVTVSAQVSDLQERVAALSSSLTQRELLQGDPGALLTLLTKTQDVEQGFAALRPGARSPSAQASTGRTPSGAHWSRSWRCSRPASPRCSTSPVSSCWRWTTSDRGRCCSPRC